MFLLTERVLFVTIFISYMFIKYIHKIHRNTYVYKQMTDRIFLAQVKQMVACCRRTVKHGSGGMSSLRNSGREAPKIARFEIGSGRFARTIDDARFPHNDGPSEVGPLSL